MRWEYLPGSTLFLVWAHGRADTRDDLTAQERQIAQLARDGLSNPEIGARLFLSPRTVEWHLRKVFAKLGIVSSKVKLSATSSFHSPTSSGSVASGPGSSALFCGGSSQPSAVASGEVRYWIRSTAAPGGS